MSIPLRVVKKTNKLEPNARACHKAGFAAAATIGLDGWRIAKRLVALDVNV